MLVYIIRPLCSQENMEFMNEMPLFLGRITLTPRRLFPILTPVNGARDILVAQACVIVAVARHKGTFNLKFKE